MKKHIYNTKTFHQKGFVALFAVLISAVVLAITLGISNVAYKEVLLTSQARDANYAFFAADTGAECALYGDLTQSGFTPDSDGNLATFNCLGTQVNFVTSNPPQFTFLLPISGTTCSSVSVDKDFPVTEIDSTGATVTTSYTKIESLGYNVSCNEVANLPTNPSLRLVERAVRVTYPNDVASSGGAVIPTSGL